MNSAAYGWLSHAMPQRLQNLYARARDYRFLQKMSIIICSLKSRCRVRVRPPMLALHVSWYDLGLREYFSVIVFASITARHVVKHRALRTKYWRRLIKNSVWLPRQALAVTKAGVGCRCRVRGRYRSDFGHLYG